MIYKILEVVDSVGTVNYVHECKVIDSTIKRRIYHDDDSYSDSQVKITIRRTLLVCMQVEFVPSADNTPMLSSTGDSEIYHLAYFYSIVIYDITDGSRVAWSHNVVYSDCGIKATNFDMYSYHTRPEPYTYPTDRLFYELEDCLDFKEIFSLDIEILLHKGE
jgi:hypothetical protein